MAMGIDAPTGDTDNQQPPAPLPSKGRAVTVRTAALDVVIGMIMAAMALALWIDAASIEQSTPGLRGPADFPRGIALIFGIISLVMAARGALALRAGRNPELATFKQPAAVAASMALVVVYPLLLDHLGYYLATGPWLLALQFVVGYRKPIPMVLCAAGFLIFTKAVFEMLIGIPLP